MHTTADRLEFAPPATRGLLRGLGLAILAHAFLVAALTWGVRWKQAPTTISAEAELWAAVPQQAAPPPPPPEPVATPAPLPPVQATPALPDPEIALEQERKRIQKEKQLLADRLEQDKRDKQRKLQEKQRELEQQRELDKRLAAEKQKAALEARRKAESKSQQAANSTSEQERQAYIRQQQIKAGGAGTSSSTGTAAQAAGPSVSYKSILEKEMRRYVKIRFELVGNPKVGVEVVSDPDGKIRRSTVTKTSGVKAFDDAVLQGLADMGVMPRDVDGRIHSSLIVDYSYK